MAVRVSEARQLYFDTDIFFGPILERFGGYSPGETDLLRHFIKPGDTVVDAGANIGCHTLTMGELVGPGGAVLAFEPQRAIYYALCGSLALREMWHVVAFQCALGEARGSIRVPNLDYTKPANFGGLVLGGEEGTPTSVFPLDDFGLKSLSFLKADVEGHETELLRGARETIARFRPILYVENDRPANSNRLVYTLLGLGYDLYLHLPPLSKYKAPDSPTIVSCMLLGIPAGQSGEITGLRPVKSPEDMFPGGQFVIRT